jgi:hypothetical protein
MNMNVFSNKHREEQLKRQMWLEALEGAAQAAGIDKKTARKYMKQFLEYGVIDDSGCLTHKAKEVFEQMDLA